MNKNLQSLIRRGLAPTVLSVGALLATPSQANAATIYLSGFGFSGTFDCSCLTFVGHTCKSFCESIDSAWNFISCSYNPQNGSITITSGALPWIERDLMNVSGELDFGASGGASMQVEPEKGYMTITGEPGEIELAALTGDGVLYEPDSAGVLTFPLFAGATVTMLRTGAPPVAAPAAKDNENFRTKVRYSTSNGTCSAKPGDLKPKQESTPVEKEATLKSTL